MKAKVWLHYIFLMSAKRKAQISKCIFKESWLNTAKQKDKLHQQKVPIKQMPFLLICRYKYAVVKYVS